MDFIKDIQIIEGVQAILKSGGDVFVVGGIVRDHFLGKESKDIDLIVRLLTVDDIEKILLPHGFVKKDVGKSFSVIKFVPHGWTKEPIDIALPRTEKKVGKGHKGFVVFADPFLKIEDDLARRDVTMNSIAISLADGKIIDPFGGIIDISKKIIRATTKSAFIEDPLRILRAIQFASRFRFKIEEETYKMIMDNVHSLDEISGERITEEFDKILKKGDIQIGFDLLKETKVLKQLTGVDTVDFKFEKKLSRSEFFFLLFKDCSSPELIFKKKLKGDNDTIKGIQALSIYRSKFKSTMTDIERRFLMVDILSTFKDALYFSILDGMELEIEQFKRKEFPTKITDLDIDGEILKDLGLKEKQIGDKLRILFSDVIEGKRLNKLEELLK
jgi:tRNA nucleotidyltransferase/poly(A) polymerase